LSIDSDKDNKNKSYDYTDFYKQNIENFNKFVEGLSKMIYNGFMYWYNKDTVDRMRKEYEKNYKQFLKDYEEFYKKYRYY
jgi:hypothetical protein